MRRLFAVFVIVFLVGCGRQLPGELTARAPTVNATAVHHRHRKPTRAELERWFLTVYLASLPQPGMQQDGYPRPWHPCGGGEYPPCWRVGTESATAGLYRAFNPTGCSGRGCYGKWQFDPLTWDGFAGAMGRPDLLGRYFGHAPADQDAVARFGWNDGKGCTHWAAC